jgi:mRNA interferase MazF
MHIRGDVHRLIADRRARGAEQRGARFGVILQADEWAQLPTVMVAPTSRSARPAAIRPLVEVEGSSTRVLLHHLRAIDRERLGRRVGHLSWEELEHIEDALRLLLDL